jgi:hypothetical protein
LSASRVWLAFETHFLSDFHFLRKIAQIPMWITFEQILVSR